MLYRSETLIEQLSEEYSNPRCRLRRLVTKGEYIPIIRGLYESDPETPGHYLAGEIYGPSYLSFEYALYKQGLNSSFEEKKYTSATCNKHKVKQHVTPFGTYVYRDVPEAVFGLEVDLIEVGGYHYSIARPEKALCDKLYSIAPIRYMSELEDLLLRDLRIEKYFLSELRVDVIKKLSEGYCCNNVKMLVNYLSC